MQIAKICDGDFNEKNYENYLKLLLKKCEIKNTSIYLNTRQSKYSSQRIECWHGRARYRFLVKTLKIKAFVTGTVYAKASTVMRSP